MDEDGHSVYIVWLLFIGYLNAIADTYIGECQVKINWDDVRYIHKRIMIA